MSTTNIIRDCRNWTAHNGSALTMDTSHIRFEKKSVRWDWLSGASISIPINFAFRSQDQRVHGKNHPTFSFWIYSERKLFGKLKFDFMRGENRLCSFEFRLNFSGWRTAWLSYLRDMNGVPGDYIDTLLISAPESEPSGTFYFDQIVPCSYIDPRFHTPDAQTPFINPVAISSVNSHWTGLYHFAQTPPSPPPPLKVEVETFQEIERIEQRLIEFIFDELDAPYIKTVHEICYMLGLGYANGQLSGPPPVSENAMLAMPPRNRGRYAKHLERCALSNHFRALFYLACRIRENRGLPDSDNFEQLFINLFDFINLNGWTTGSAQGSLIRFGYEMRHLAPALIVVKSMLRRRKRLNAAVRMLRWFSGVGRIYAWEQTPPGVCLSTLDTQALPMLVSILLDDNARDKVRDLEVFAKWLGRCMEPSEGLRNGFKADGGGFHHLGFYPISASDALRGIIPVIAALAGSSFDISGTAWRTVNKAATTLAACCAGSMLPISFSARFIADYHHVNPQMFYFLTLAAEAKTDKPAAAAAAACYLRLTENSGDVKNICIRNALLSRDYEPTSPQTGFQAFNSAAAAIHRGRDWIASLKGHSCYVWRTETYPGANLFGRYISFGQMEIMNLNSRVKPYRHDGWNWNFWPAITAVMRPIDSLRSDVRNLDEFSGFEEMLFSRSSFAGGLSAGHGIGVFGLVLTGHQKYEDDFSAKKSYFLLDDFILCLGSGISCNDAVCPVFTCLFQTPADAAATPAHAVSLGGCQLSISRLDGCGNPRTWITDTLGNAYYIPNGDYTITLGPQESIAHDNSSKTSGNFACAWLDHSICPDNAGYEYAVLPAYAPGIPEKFIQSMNSQSKPYVIIRKDSAAHIVDFPAIDTTVFVAFRPGIVSLDQLIRGVNRPLIAVAHKEMSGYSLHLCCPDLNLYEGEDMGQFDSQGNQVEVSVYSRKWIDTPGTPLKVKVELKGTWNLADEYDFCSINYESTNGSILEFTSVNAMSVHIMITH